MRSTKITQFVCHTYLQFALGSKKGQIMHIVLGLQSSNPHEFRILGQMGQEWNLHPAVVEHPRAVLVVALICALKYLRKSSATLREGLPMAKTLAEQLQRVMETLARAAHLLWPVLRLPRGRHGSPQREGALHAAPCPASR